MHAAATMIEYYCSLHPGAYDEKYRKNKDGWNRATVITNRDLLRSARKERSPQYLKTEAKFKRLMKRKV